ncbi:MAG: hypothetical protein NTAFB05_04240 [Nitrobacter sp.]
MALIPRIAAADMIGRPQAPILLHAIDALRRARKLPVSAARNDLRQLARGLRNLYRTGAYAHLQSFESPAPGSESMR